MMFNNQYQQRRVLVTGHTGFKGSWLVYWLKALGAEVSGISLSPETKPNHWDLLQLDIDSHYLDIRDEPALRKKIRQLDPQVVFHLAAQPLVRRSYRQPLDTWSSNVMGTAHVLDACRELDNLQAMVMITSDKCYDNKEWVWGYRENDPLGGHDPYSASKGASELVAASYRRSYFNDSHAPLLATARAGNVIGGGDWSEDRLIPDLVRSIAEKTTLQIRSPEATRPWQHVLECLSGYLLLGQKLLEGQREFADAWNFGPDSHGNRKVQQVLEAMQQVWPVVNWQTPEQPQPHEAQWLQLDSSKSRQMLNWKPVWSFEQGVEMTAQWYQAWLDNNQLITEQQLQSYITSARDNQLCWVAES